MNIDPVITGIGVVASNGNSCADFWNAQESAESAISPVSYFSTERFKTKISAQIKNFNAKEILGPKGLRNFDNNTLYLLAASKEALDSSGVSIDENDTDDIGVCVGTCFSHIGPIITFDKEMMQEGIDFANPALFPPTVLNAPASYVSIRNKIQGFSSTITAGYSSGIEAVAYSINALETGKVKTVFCGGVDSINEALFFSLYRLECMAGVKGVPLSCPFDMRRNGFVFGEGSAMFCIEDRKEAEKRGAHSYARILGVGRFFELKNAFNWQPSVSGIKKAILDALHSAGISASDVDYISSCANSSFELDRAEVAALKDVFGSKLDAIPVSSVKSMIGETFGASGPLQIASVIGALNSGVVPPTINYSECDPECDIDCVPNIAQKKDISTALVVSSGPDGYNSALVLERCGQTNNK